MRKGQGWDEYYECDRCTCRIGRDTGQYRYGISGDEFVNGHDKDDTVDYKDLCGRCAIKAKKHFDKFFKEK